MKKNIIITTLLLMAAVMHAEDKINIKKKTAEKNQDGKVIEKHFYYKEIIKEVPKEEEEYIKHLYEELKSPLRHPKKIAAVRRVEDNLIELNKGSIHKIREGDVYKIVDKEGKYKGKIEMDAIADTVSIGSSYFVKDGIEVFDEAKFVGQRRFWGSGLIYGGSKVGSDVPYDDDYFKGGGLYWRFLFKKAWGIGFAAANFSKEEGNTFFPVYGFPSEWEKYRSYYVNRTGSISYDSEYSFTAPIDIRKYFFHPTWYTCYAGVGTAYFSANYEFKAIQYFPYKVINEIDDTEKKFVPIATMGTELGFAKYFRIVLSGYYMHGPRIEIDGYEPFTRPFIFSLAILGAW